MKNLTKTTITMFFALTLFAVAPAHAQITMPATPDIDALAPATPFEAIPSTVTSTTHVEFLVDGVLVCTATFHSNFQCEGAFPWMDGVTYTLEANVYTNDSGCNPPQETFMMTVTAHDPVPLHRFYNSTTINSLYKLDTALPSSNWVYQGICCMIFDVQVDGSVPLYRIHSDIESNHYYSANPAQIASKLGDPTRDWTNQITVGYIHVDQRPGTVALYHAHLPDENDFYTTDWANWQEKINNKGYKVRKIAGYVHP